MVAGEGHASSTREALDAFFSDPCRSRKVRYTIRRIVKDEDDTDDVFQDTFVKAAAGANGFRGGTPLDRWVVTVAWNAALEFLRSHRGLGLGHQPGSLPAHFAETAADPAPEPSEQVFGLEVDRQFSRLLERLPADQQALVAAKLDGEPYRAAYRRLGVDPNVGWYAVTQAKRFLRPRLTRIGICATV